MKIQKLLLLIPMLSACTSLQVIHITNRKNTNNLVRIENRNDDTRDASLTLIAADDHYDIIATNVTAFSLAAPNRFFEVHFKPEHAAESSLIYYGAPVQGNMIYFYDEGIRNVWRRGESFSNTTTPSPVSIPQPQQPASTTAQSTADAAALSTNNIASPAIQGQPADTNAVKATVTIAGNVRDEKNNPADADVVLFRKTGEGAVAVAERTNARGDYSFTVPDNADYFIVATAKNKMPVELAVASPASNTNRISDLTMPSIRTGGRMTFENVLFEKNKWLLLPSSRPVLDRIIVFLKENPSVSIAIIGHTDSTGGRDFNMKLSQKRAESMRDYLISSGGVERSRITAKGAGDASPVAPNSTEENRILNRRGEIVILK